MTYLHGWLTGLSSILKMCFFGTPLSSPSRAAPSRISLWRRMRGVKGRENSILDHSGLSPLCEYFSTIPSLFLSLPSNHSLILVFPLQSLCFHSFRITRNAESLVPFNAQITLWSVLLWGCQFSHCVYFLLHCVAQKTFFWGENAFIPPTAAAAEVSTGGERYGRQTMVNYICTESEPI